MRTEHDSIGSINLPDDAYYGVQSMRAKENFPMTGRLMHPYMVDSLVIIKKAAAMANQRAGVLKPEIASAIIRACDEILGGKLRDQRNAEGAQQHRRALPLKVDLQCAKPSEQRLDLAHRHSKQPGGGAYRDQKRKGRLVFF